MLRQTHSRRIDIVDIYLDENKEFWGGVGEMGDILGSDGMSSDETDDENSQGATKAVRRVRKAWLSEEVAEVWRTVEAYHQSRNQGKSKRGNKAFARNPVPASQQSYNRIKPGLPQNYYDPVWWQSIIDSDKLLMKPQPHRPLPDINTYVLTFSLLIFIMLIECCYPRLKSSVN